MKISSSLWIVPFICFALGYLTLAHYYPAKTINTPTLVGLQLEQACIILSEHNLNPRIIAHKEEADLLPGTILSQTPMPCSAIKPTQSVFLVLSKQPDKLIAPVLIQLSLADAQKKTQPHDIRLKTFYVHSNMPKDHCVAQYPSANMPLEEKKMTIYLSDGLPKPVLLPNFKGKNSAQVIEFLKAHDIAYQLYSAQGIPLAHAQGIVTDQRPLAYSIIETTKNLNIHLQVQ